jgi:Ni/Co efflux regulator RcnB
MKRLLLIIATVALLAAPGAAAAAKPSKADKREAQKECRAERGTTDATREAFRAKYGTNANKKNAFGKCVSQKAKAKAAQAEEEANAAQQCDAERGDTAESEKAFADKYGTNGNKKNAFGKCVSAKAEGNEG